MSTNKKKWRMEKNLPKTEIAKNGILSHYNLCVIVAFSFTKGAYKEAARAGSEGLKIRLIRVQELL
jgi:hypothetical protein